MVPRACNCRRTSVDRASKPLRDTRARSAPRAWGAEAPRNLSPRLPHVQPVEHRLPLLPVGARLPQLAHRSIAIMEKGQALLRGGTVGARGDAGVHQLV